MSEEKTYNQDVVCKNCSFDSAVNIPLGIKVEDFKCPNCGCKELLKKMKPIRLVPHVEDYS